VALAARARARYAAFCDALSPAIAADSAPLPVFLDFLLALSNENLSAATVQGYAGEIDRQRRLRGESSHCDSVEYKAFAGALRKTKPTHSKLVGHVPFAPRTLVPFLQPASDFSGLRERALFTARVDCISRAGEPYTWSRTSIRAATDPLGRDVVVFVFNSKRSAAQHVAGDSNYCCHTHTDDDDGRSALTLCPACLLLRLKARVDALPGAAAHDRLFTDESGAALSRQRVRNIITALMRRAHFDDVFTSHSLRHATNQALQLAGVDAATIALRAGWSDKWSNASQRQHYTHHRFVTPLFAKLLLY
jgi:hypothetical protein